MINFYPPYVGAGIRLAHLSRDFKKAVVTMKLRWWNKNMVGTHFGGSLMAMSDPFYMLLIMENLGRGYIVWDKASTIRFKKPGKGKVTCVFEITDAILDQLKTEADTHGKTEMVLPLQITDEKGEVVSELEKTIYVRRKGA
ncbi:DUF4442 domain-containing protein [Roseivirga sp.]|uniref:DUF4442 domain-containing protein n=1 Tax=Roseivirga sp. TaxID=1964215 RepID=UPI003B519EB5